ncbi:MAG: hypothetical protein AAGA21_23650 [Pseudomonadota bacterium]
MGSWLGGKSTVSNDMTFVLSGRRHFGVSPSILRAIANRDLRHPNPVRPVVSDPTSSARTPTRAALLAHRALGGPRSFMAAPSPRVAAQDQRIVVVEDK